MVSTILVLLHGAASRVWPRLGRGIFVVCRGQQRMGYFGATGRGHRLFLLPLPAMGKEASRVCWAAERAVCGPRTRARLRPPMASPHKLPCTAMGLGKVASIAQNESAAPIKGHYANACKGQGPTALVLQGPKTHGQQGKKQQGPQGEQPGKPLVARHQGHKGRRYAHQGKAGKECVVHWSGFIGTQHGSPKVWQQQQGKPWCQHGRQVGVSEFFMQQGQGQHDICQDKPKEYRCPEAPCGALFQGA